MGAPRASYVKRARISAQAGPYLLLAGVLAFGAGAYFGSIHWPIAAVMAVTAPLLQIPRQRAWLTQNDTLELASLVAMPLLLAVLAWFWLRPAGSLNVATILQGFGGFFVGIGLFHIAMKRHTMALADKIETQMD